MMLLLVTGCLRMYKYIEKNYWFAMDSAKGTAKQLRDLSKIYMDSIKGNISIKPDTLRKQFMLEAFKHTAEYDAAISSWMSENV